MPGVRMKLLSAAGLCAGGAAYLITQAFAPEAALLAALIVTLAIRSAAMIFGWRLIRGSGRV
mgnify:CR=1 FL=1